MKITMKQIDKIAKDVLQEHYLGMTEDNIKDEMMELIKNQESKVILQALGLEKGWNGEINVRYSGSFADIAKILGEQYLKSAAKSFLSGLFENAKIELTETQKNALRKSYKESYFETAKDEIENLAREQALVDAPELFKNFMEQQEKEINDQT